MKRKREYKSYLRSPSADHSDIPKQTKSSFRTRGSKKQIPIISKLLSEADSETTKIQFADYSDCTSDSVMDSDCDLNYSLLDDNLSESGSDFEEPCCDQDEAIRNDTKLLFPGARITNTESAHLLYSFILRHKISKSAVKDLLKLVHLHLHSSATFSTTTTHKLFKTLNFDYSSGNRHLYCSNCQEYLDESHECVRCRLVHSEKELIESGSFFYSFNARETIMDLLKNQVIANSLYRGLVSKNTNSSEGYYASIVDGYCYKQLNLGSDDFTCLLNTDGIPVFKSSKFSLWPILFSISEIPSKHILTLGLWFGQSKPNFDTFLQPILNTVKDLAVTGVRWRAENKIIVSRVFFPLLVADSVARPIVQGLVQFNGAYGCTWCLAKGQSIKLLNKASHKWIYPPLSKPELEIRNRLQFLNHLREFDSILTTHPRVKNHFGVKNASKLLLFPKFDIVNGFVFDYMHTALLGICRTFTNIWLDSKNHSEGFYIGKRESEIDRNLLMCRVPSSFNRTVRSIKHRRFWKATEWRTWLYTISLTLNNILQDKYLFHFLKFAEAVQILCSDHLDQSSVNMAEDLLFSFVMEVKLLYGESYCSYNVHLMLHAAQCVRNWGPLHQYSAFTFESFNGTLLGYFQGTQHVMSQISRHILEVLQFSQRRFVFRNSYACDFYDNSLIVGERNKSSNSNYTLFGFSIPYIFSKKERKKLLEHSMSDCQSGVRYPSLLIGSRLYQVCSKTTTKRCNSVCSSAGVYYQICDIILVYSNLVLIVARRLVCNAKLNCSNVFVVEKIKKRKTILTYCKLDQTRYLVIYDPENPDGNLSHIVKLPNVYEV